MGRVVKLSSPSIEQYEFNNFMSMYRTRKKYAGQRLGQAFYNHFDLHKVDDQASLYNLYCKDGDQALRLIEQLFVIS